jgi:Transposase and inactivated derivatives
MNRSKRYDEEFKQSIVNLYHSGKSQLQLSKDYGVAPSTISKWIKQYSEVQIDDQTILTAKQIKDLQKRNAALENVLLY